MRPWWERHVGRPFGQRPGEVTCWALVREIYAERLGVDLPPFGDVSAAYLGALARLSDPGASAGDVARAWARVRAAFARGQAAENWLPVAAPRELDVCLMRTGGARVVGHVGVMLDARRCLHVEADSAAVVEPVDGWHLRGRVLGFRRFRCC